MIVGIKGTVPFILNLTKDITNHWREIFAPAAQIFLNSTVITPKGNCMKTLDWRNHHQRIDTVNGILNSEVLEDISNSKIEYCYSDDLSWLPDYFNLELFTEKFLENFKAIKCFHACSPIRIESYLSDGFTGGNHEKNIELFKNIFSDIPQYNLEQAIKEHTTREDEFYKTFFCCDSKVLINQDGNYLIYGSEFLSSLTTRLHHQKLSNENYKQRLKGLGIPTIIEANIDFSLLDNYQINSLIKNSLADWGNYHLFSTDFKPSEMSIITKQKLLPSVIVNHWHPEKIYDPYNSSWYIPEQTRCFACKEL